MAGYQFGIIILILTSMLAFGSCDPSPVMASNISIDGSYQNYNSITNYSLNSSYTDDMFNIEFSQVEKPSYSYTQALMLTNYELDDSLRAFLFTNLAQHSLQANKLENTLSVGLGYKAFDVSVGKRSDILGNAWLIRPAFTFQHKLGGFTFKQQYAYIYTHLNSYIGTKLKVVTGVFADIALYAAYNYKQYLGSNDSSYNWKLKNISIGMEIQL